MPRFKVRYVFEEEVEYGDLEEAREETDLEANQIARERGLTLTGEATIEEVNDGGH